MFDSATPSDASPAPALNPEIEPPLAFRLPADAYWHLVHTLLLALPPPLTDSPECLARRNAAIARIAALAPANAAKADLAAQ